MTFPPINADENASVPWPEPSSPVDVRSAITPSGHPANEERQDTTETRTSKSGERRMTWKDFVNISISMAGAQIAWTLELG